MDVRAEPARATLLDVLRLRALEDPGGWALTFLADGERDEARLSYAELDERARAIAALLRERLPEQGSALLLHPPGLDYVAALVGCLYAGAVAVPTAPPGSRRGLERLLAIAADAQADVALTSASAASDLRRALGAAPDVRFPPLLATDQVDLELAGDWEEPELDASSLALVQYTSGSTRTPRGVVLDHGNLVHNQRAIGEAFGHTCESVAVGWLPLYHDMGLIGYVLHPLYAGFPCVLMPPERFVERPLRWLEAIQRFGGTTSGGPNFAYDLCVRTTTPEQRAALDLSSWRVAFDGAEPVRAKTLRSFAAAFEPAGFRPEAFFPCYGLAEATLIVAGRRGTPAELVRRFDRDGLERGHANEVDDGTPEGTALVSVGPPLGDQDLRVVDPKTLEPLPPGRVGEIWIAGSSVARGYASGPGADEDVFGARLPPAAEPFLRTGDLGFLHGGELFVAGRLKDLIVVRGRNYHPQDVELTVEESHPALRPGCGAAVAVDVAGEERLVVLHEVRRPEAEDADAAIASVRERIGGGPGYGRLLGVQCPAALRRLVAIASGRASPRACRRSCNRYAWRP